MINNENLEKLKQSLVENDNKWNENFEMMNTAFKEKYGVLANASFRDLGLSEDYDIYRKNKKILENKIVFEINDAINKIAQTISAYNVEVEIFDYRLPFQLCTPSQHDYKTEIIKPTTLSQVQRYFMEFDNEIDLNTRHRSILKESFFFNHLDVTLTNGKFPYKYLINEAKYNFRALKMFDEKNKITIIGKIIKLHYNHHCIENPQESNEFGKFKYGIDSVDLKDFFYEFIRLNDSKMKEKLMELDGIENVKKNLFIVDQFFNELENLKR